MYLAFHKYVSKSLWKHVNVKKFCMSTVTTNLFSTSRLAMTNTLSQSTGGQKVVVPVDIQLFSVTCLKTDLFTHVDCKTLD